MPMSNQQGDRPLPVRIAQALINLVSSARYQVDGDSMLPSLASKQYVLAVPRRFSWNLLRRGDIVVLRHPVLSRHVYIKRIVGLPDEDIRLEGGQVSVNGRPLPEVRLNGQSYHRGEYDREWWIGSDEYFVMGDNRHNSQDSRTFGPINARLIIGRVWFRYWPLNTWGPIRGWSTQSPAASDV